MKRSTFSLSGLFAVLALAVASPPAAQAATKYKNCTALNKVYKNGVGRPGARDSTSSGKPVTTFKVDRATYNSNTHLDRDKDGVACEKK